METEEISSVKIEGTQHESNHEVSQGQVAKRPLLESNEITENVRSDFQCDMCGKSLLSKRNLQRHYWTHTGERPFQCNLASRSLIEEKS